MITEKALILSRGKAKDVMIFLLNPQKHGIVNTRSQSVACFDGLVKGLLSMPALECQIGLTNDKFGYSEDYSFYVGSSSSACIKLNLRACEEWQTYSRSIYKPSSLADYKAAVSSCQANIGAPYRQPIIDVLADAVLVAQQNYMLYVDGDYEDFIFSVENKQRFNKLTLSISGLLLQ